MAHHKKIRQKGRHVIFFSKTLKWRDVLINEVVELKRKKRAEERKVGRQKMNHVRITLGMSCVIM